MTRLQKYLGAYPARARWIYASVAGAAAALTMLGFFLLVRQGQSFQPENALSVLALGVIGFLSGAVCWPRGPRSGPRMVRAGLLTVLMAYALFGTVLSMLVLIKNGNWVEALGMIPFVIIMGSILTLFIPYLVGAGLSVMFREPQ